MQNGQRPLKVFLCYAHSDVTTVHRLYDRLKKDGVDVWLDKENLLPGQNWRTEIQKAVNNADAVIVCHSKEFNQKGFRQREVRLALDVAMEQPPGEIFMIPARLEDCDVLETLSEWHWVDLFEDGGYDALMRALCARADEVGAALPLRKSWFPKVTTPRNKQKPTPEKRPGEGEPLPVKNSEGVKSKARRRPNTAVIVALIGFTGTIIAGLLTSPLLEKWLSPVASPTVLTTTAFTSTTSPTKKPPSVTSTASKAAPTRSPVPTSSTARFDPSPFLSSNAINRSINIGSSANSIAFSPNGDYLAAGATNGKVHFLNMRNGNDLDLAVHTNLVSSVAFSPDGKLFASGSYDKTVNVRSTTNLQTEYKKLVVPTYVTALAFSPDGKWLAAGLASSGKLKDADLYVWNVSTLSTRGSAYDVQPMVLSMSSTIPGVAFSPDSKLLASSEHSRGPAGASVVLWDVATGEWISSFMGFSEGKDVSSVAFSPTEKILAFATYSGKILLFNYATGNQVYTIGSQLRTLDIGYDKVNSVLFSPDGKVLLVGAYVTRDDGITFWNVSDGRKIGSIDVGNLPLNDMALSPDAKIVAYAGDNTGAGFQINLFGTEDSLLSNWP